MRIIQMTCHVLRLLLIILHFQSIEIQRIVLLLLFMSAHALRLLFEPVFYHRT